MTHNYEGISMQPLLPFYKLRIILHQPVIVLTSAAENPSELINFLSNGPTGKYQK